MTIRKASFVLLASLLWVVQVASAEVRTEEKTKVEFPGLLGGFMKVFGGKAARSGIVDKVALKGNRKMTSNDETAQLIDLGEEKVYQIDVKKKSYTVTTFAQMRKQMEDAMAKAKAEAASQPNAKPDPQQGQKQPDYVVDFKLQESGQKKAINGYNCREVVAIVTVREKDKPASDGSMVLTTNMWLAPRIAAMKELEDFDRRFAEKLALPFDPEMVENMRPAMAAYPGLGSAMGKMEVEKVKMDGTAILTVMSFESAGNANTQTDSKTASTSSSSDQRKQSSSPTSIGGLLGGLRGKPKEDQPASSKPAAIMTSTHELVSLSTSVADGDVSIPTGFKEKK